MVLDDQLGGITIGDLDAVSGYGIDLFGLRGQPGQDAYKQDRDCQFFHLIFR